MRRLLPMAAVLLAATNCGATDDRAAAPTPTPTPTPTSAPRHFAAAQATAAPTTAPTATPTATPARPAGRFLTAALQRKVRLHATRGGRVLARIGPETEFGSPSVLGVVRRRGPWLEVVASQLRNDRRGWIRARRGVSVRTTDLSIRVDRSARRARLRDGERTVLTFPVAVGRPGNETPLGRYAVTDKLRPTDPSSPYGCCAIALTGHQTRLEPGWPGGDRLAIHGTPQPSSIGQAASLGCLRAPKRALNRLMRRVPLGAPVFVRA